MKKNFLFGMLALLLAGFWFGGASLADCVAADTQTGEHVAELTNPEAGDVLAKVSTSNTYYYCSLRDAVENAVDGATITLLKNDDVSFTEDNLEIEIDKSLTIEGSGFTLYGVNDYEGNDYHDLFISAGNVTINNLKMSGFAGNHLNYNTYPIWTSQGYAGTLTLENVTIDNFSRTAINANGGRVIVSGCTITGNPGNENSDYFQSGIEAYKATVTVTDTIITGMGANDTEGEWSKAACVQIGGLPTQTDGKATITLEGNGNSCNGQYSLIANARMDGGSIVVEGGTFVGDFLIDTDDGGDNPAEFKISGGTFSVDPSISGYVVEGLYAFPEGENFVVEEARVVSEIAISGIVKPVAGNTATTGGIKITTKGVELEDAYWILNEATQTEESNPGTDPETVEPELNNPVVNEPKNIETLETEAVAETDESEVTKFTGTFEEGKQYVLRVLYNTGAGYQLADELTINEEAKSDGDPQIAEDGKSVDLTYTAAAKPTSTGTSGGGGGGSSKVTKDDTKSDTSDTTKVNEKNTDEQANQDGTDSDGAGSQNAGEDKYNKEFHDAYEFAFKNGITTMPSISEADMEGGLTRIAMAKMLSNYAINVLGKTPNTGRNISFTDVSPELNAQYNSGVTLAYQLGIMGINMPENKFRPFDPVTRAEFVTALSRMLFEIADGVEIYYEPHMLKLLEEKIITVADPSMLELRGYVMIMLMRSAEK